jgi:hypothetical protein
MRPIKFTGETVLELSRTMVRCSGQAGVIATVRGHTPLDSGERHSGCLA